MILRQFLHTDPVAASYLFGCGGKASAAVVDPVGDIAPYLELRQRPACVSSTSSTPTSMPTIPRRRARSPRPRCRICALRGREGRVPVPRRQGRRSSGTRQRHRNGPAYARPYAGAHLAARHRSDARRRAMVRSDGPHADGRRSRPHGTCRQCRGRRAGNVCQRAPPEGASRPRGNLPGAYLGLGLRASLSGKPTSTIGFEKRHNQAFGIDDENVFVAP